jgi:hypothetical protein
MIPIKKLKYTIILVGFLAVTPVCSAQTIIDSNRIQGQIEIEPIKFFTPMIKTESSIWYGRFGLGFGNIHKNKRQTTLLPDFTLNYNSSREELLTNYINPVGFSYLKQGGDVHIKYRIPMKGNWSYAVNVGVFARDYGIRDKSYADFDVEETAVKQTGMDINGNMTWYWGINKNMTLDFYAGLKTGKSEGEVRLTDFSSCIVCIEEHFNIDDSFVSMNGGIQLGFMIGR